MNDIIILEVGETCDGEDIVKTYEFEFDGIKGKCERRFNVNTNTTRLMYDGYDEEWGIYDGKWDYKFNAFITDPKYNKFRKAAEEAFDTILPD